MFAATILGLLSALFYGATDFAAAMASRRGGVLRTMIYGQGAAALLLSLVLLHIGIPRAPTTVWALLIVTNIVNLAGTAILFRGMALGRLTVVAPLAAAYGGIGALLSLMAGDALPPMRWIGLCLLCGGAVLSARPPARIGPAEGQGSDLSAAAHGLAAALLYGAGFWVQGYKVVPVLGGVVPAWSYYAMGALLAPLAAVGRGASLALPGRGMLGAAIATGLLGAGGYLTLSAGQATGEVAIVTALSSLASGITVLLARLFMAERSGLAGAGGLALILSGLVLIQL